MSIICKICNIEFKSIITNKHLASHNVTTAYYKDQYGIDSLSSTEYKTKLSKARKGNNNPNYGKVHSLETKNKMSTVKKGKIPWNKGIPMIQEHKDKLSTTRKHKINNGEIVHWNLGNKTSEETKDKISNSIKLYANDNHDELSNRANMAIDTKIAKGIDIAFFRGRTHSDYSKQIISEKSKIVNIIKREKSHIDILSRIISVNLELLSDINCGFSEPLELKCLKCSNIFKFTKQYFTKSKINTDICPHCHPRKYHRSEGEIQLYVFIKSIKNDALHNYRQKYSNMIFEMDIYVPSLNLAFEYNGLYWHSEIVLEYNNKSKWNDYKKYIELSKNNIKLITVFEDEWLNNPDIVKSRIRGLLNGIHNKIYARNCVVKEISSKECSIFCKNNHIQSKGRSNIRLGLFSGDILVSVMTFCKNNISRKNYNSWELNRFCSLLNTTVVGGASKLFSYFKKNYNIDTVISYADRRWSSGDIYKLLGFKCDRNTFPNYWYFLPNELKRINRYTLRKTSKDDPNKTEKEIREDQGYYRIWDCGNSKWVWNR